MKRDEMNWDIRDELFFFFLFCVYLCLCLRFLAMGCLG